MSDNSTALVPRFYKHTVANEQKTREAGRPIFDEQDVCEIRMAGNKQTVGVFPAHEVFKQIKNNYGDVEPLTYALAFPDQWRKYKNDETQELAGTPLTEAPFISAGKRLELKALNIHTVEALAGLDGQPLKLLGMGGREMKTNAQAYLDKAAGSADVTALAAQIAALEQIVKDQAEMISAVKGLERRQVGSPLVTSPDEDAPPPHVKALDEFTDAELKAYIKEETGEAVKGNPSRSTLLDRALEIATRPEDEAA